MGTTELKTYSCKCSRHTCAMIGTDHPLGCCKYFTATGWLWSEDLEFDNSLFNLNCVPEEAKYISRDAGGYINVWTDLPTKYPSYYSASPALLVESASNTLNGLFRYNSKEENAEKRDTEEKCLMSLLQRPNLYPEYQKDVFIKAKTSNTVYKIKSRQGYHLELDKVYPKYFANIGSITLDEAERCHYIVEKDQLLLEELRDLVGKSVTHNGRDFFIVSGYRHLAGSGVFLDTGYNKDFMTEYDLLRMEYRTREGKPCYNFKIKEKM